LPKLQQVGFDGMGFAGVDTHLGHHVHADFFPVTCNSPLEWR
jgi:hypothetical protein